jgi:hypothetical protein
VLGALALGAGAAVALPPWLGLLPAAVVLAHVPALRRASPDALTNRFAAQARYKRLLHRAIGAGALVLALCLALSRLVA